MQATYRFVSVLNEQGFIEGRYVPVIDGQTEVSSQSLPATSPRPEQSSGSSNGDGSVRERRETEGDADKRSSEPAPLK